MNAFISTAAVLLLTTAACLPNAAPMPPDASDATPPPPPAPGSPIAVACANMQTAGCPEGLAVNCAVAIAQTIDAGVTPINVSCLDKATTVSAVQACGIACKLP